MVIQCIPLRYLVSVQMCKPKSQSTVWGKQEEWEAAKGNELVGGNEATIRASGRKRALGLLRN